MFSAAAKLIPFRKAMVIIAGTLAAVFIALLVTAAVGAAHANADAMQVPTRTILVTDAGKGAVIESDLPLGQSDQLVRVDGAYLHLNLDAQSVKEQGWKISKSPMDPKSPIQVYNLAPVK